MNARETLNFLKWGERCDPARVAVTYIHRGAPGDIRKISGDEIRELDRSFMVLEECSIPYHRIVLIEREGETLFRRRRKNE